MPRVPCLFVAEAMGMASASVRRVLAWAAQREQGKANLQEQRLRSAAPRGALPESCEHGRRETLMLVPMRHLRQQDEMSGTSMSNASWNAVTLGARTGVRYR